MTTRDQAAAVAAATKKLKAKERKGYFTYRAESLMRLMLAQVLLWILVKHWLR